jgi:hypothetical protein
VIWELQILLINICIEQKSCDWHGHNYQVKPVVLGEEKTRMWFVHLLMLSKPWHCGKTKSVNSTACTQSWSRFSRIRCETWLQIESEAQGTQMPQGHATSSCELSHTHNSWLPQFSQRCVSISALALGALRQDSEQVQTPHGPLNSVASRIHTHTHTHTHTLPQPRETQPGKGKA